MKKQELAKNIVHYIFPQHEGRIWANSATVILNGNKAMLIDMGYKYQTSMLLEDLASNNIEVEAVIVTHFHDDHMEGLKQFFGMPVYGSSRFQDALDLFNPKEEHAELTPSIIVNEPLSISYGEHNITLTPNPGHSTCGMLINIDNQFLHVADEIMFTADGLPLVPIIDDGTKDVKMHIDSLSKLKGYDNFTIIPSHGPVFSGDKLANEVENRCIYLKALLGGNRNISFEEATRDCTCTFVHNRWHDNNCS